MKLRHLGILAAAVAVAVCAIPARADKTTPQLPVLVGSPAPSDITLLYHNGTLVQLPYNQLLSGTTINAGQLTGIPSLPTPIPTSSDSVLGYHSGAVSAFSIGSLATSIASLTASASATATVACNGANGTDDGPAINSQIAALVSTYTSATLTIPFINSGICAIGTPIIVPANVTLQGASRNVTLIRKTGATMEAMLYNAPQAAIDPFASGTYRPSVRNIGSGYPDLVGATPQVYDWSVANNWYNSGQTIQNLTFDGNGSDTTGAVTEAMITSGDAHFTHQHLTFQHFHSNGQTDSIWYSAYFTVDDEDNEDVYQGTSVQLASYGFSVNNIRTIGFVDSGVACISNPYTGGVPGGGYDTPYKGHWSNLTFDGFGTGDNGFDYDSCIDMTVSGLHVANVTVYGLNAHSSAEGPGGYLNATDVSVENTGNLGEGGIRIGEPAVTLTNVTSNNNNTNGIWIVGDVVANGSGGYVDAQVRDVTISNPTVQKNSSTAYGTLIQSLTTTPPSGSNINTTVKHVTLSGGTIGDPSAQQVLGLSVVQAVPGTVDDISVVGTTLRPSSSGLGVNWGGVAHFQYFPSGTDSAAGDFASLNNIQMPAPTVATSASPHPGSDIFQFVSSDWNGTAAVTNLYNLQAANGSLFCAAACTGLAIGNTSLTQTGLSFNSSGDTWGISTSSTVFNIGPAGTNTGAVNLFTNGFGNPATFSVDHTGNATAANVTDTALTSGSLVCATTAGKLTTTGCSTAGSQQYATYNSAGTGLSVATGTSASTYQALGAASITTGVSSGPLGKWYVVSEEDLSVASASSTQAEYGCLAISAGTAVAATVAGSSTCYTGAGQAGAPPFGETSTFTGMQSEIIWRGYVPNSTAFPVTCYVAGTGTTSVTVYGTCTTIATPI